MFQKIILWVSVVLFIIGAALYTRFYTLGQESQNYSSAGLHEGKLIPCPDKPNCVSSELADDSAHYIAPMVIKDQDWSSLQVLLRQAIRQDGGTVKNTSALYLAAEYQSEWFGFVDDVEFRFSPDDSLLHIRSGSRVGHSDLGKNAQRVARLKTLIEKLLNAS